MREVVGHRIHLRLCGLLVLTVIGCTEREASDPHYCGHPPHDCLGGACVDGVCQPVLIAPAQDAFVVAVDDTRVYWASVYATKIDWAMKDGSSQGTLATFPECSMSALAADAKYVYGVCGEIGYGALIAVSKDGSLSTLIDAGATGVAVSPSGQVVVSANGAIQAWPNDGGPPLAYGSAFFNLAADDAGVYWSDFDNIYPSSLFSNDTCGNDASAISAAIDGVTTTVGDGRPPTFGLATNGDSLIWTDSCARTLNVVKHSGEATVLAENLGAKPNSYSLYSYNALTGPLVADTAAVYMLVTAHVGMSLIRIPLDGGAAQTLSGVFSPSNLAMDETSVYLAANGGVADAGTPGIYRVAKDRAGPTW